MNRVKSIQVGGHTNTGSLAEACRAFYGGLYDGTLVRHKIIFVIETDLGYRQITIRDEGDTTVAYGDFEGLQSFYEYALETAREEEED